MCQEEIAIAKVMVSEFIDTFLFPPCNNWPKCEFEERAYSRWAAMEILNRLDTRKNMSAINIIQEFTEEMLDYERETDKWEKVRIFRTAREIAEDIASLFL